MKNKILNKKFFIRNQNIVYCGKCGKKIPNDSYMLKKHAAECGFSVAADPKIFENDKEFAYAFKISKDGNTLFFYVFKYRLIPIAGFKDRFSGGIWEKVYTAAFKRRCRDIKEKGLYNIDFWMKLMMDKQNIPSLSAEADSVIFQNFFPDVIGIESYGSFIDIYRNKGYGETKPENKDDSRNLFAHECHMEDFLEESGPLIRNMPVIHVNGKIQDINGRKAMFISVTEDGGMHKPIQFIIARGYARNNLNDAASQILKLFLMQESNKPRISLNQNIIEFCCNQLSGFKKRKVQNCIPEKEILEFDRLYPEFMLKQYIESGGTNILIPFLASNFSKCLELVYKAGITKLADELGIVKKNNHLMLYKNNIKEIFGIPVKTLKRVYSDGCWCMMDRLRDIYQQDQRYLSLSGYSRTAIDFLKYQNITLNKDFKQSARTYAEEINLWSDQDKFHTLKYLNRIEDGESSWWIQYLDYIRISIYIGRFVYGKWPKDLKTAHDIVWNMGMLKNDKEKETSFKEYVESRFYLSFVTSDLDEAWSENSIYAIYAPKTIADMYNESAQMHNCVRTYVEDVCRKKTMIFFLRKKEDPEKSVCTIEVSPQKELIQLKSFGNKKAGKNEKEFVRQWAEAKGIKLISSDMY